MATIEWLLFCLNGCNYSQLYIKTKLDTYFFIHLLNKVTAKLVTSAVVAVVLTILTGYSFDSWSLRILTLTEYRAQGYAVLLCSI